MSKKYLYNNGYIIITINDKYAHFRFDGRSETELKFMLSDANKLYNQIESGCFFLHTKEHYREANSSHIVDTIVSSNYIYKSDKSMLSDVLKRFILDMSNNKFKDDEEDDYDFEEDEEDD